MFWKGYFWFLILFVIYNFSQCVKHGLVRNWEITDLAISLVVFLGLYGFAWQKAIVSDQFWKLFVVVFIVWNIYHGYFVPYPDKFVEMIESGPVKMSQTTLATLNLIPYLPSFAALYLYAFKRPGLWS